MISNLQLCRVTSFIAAAGIDDDGNSLVGIESSTNLANDARHREGEQIELGTSSA